MGIVSGATDFSEVKALTFDVFGTVVDYRTTIIREGSRLNARKGMKIDWAKFADAWRGRYRPSMERVMNGEIGWTNLDMLHQMALDELLVEFEVDHLFDEDDKVHLNTIWHRLEPWGDSVVGLSQLKKHFILCTLSNGNISLLTNMAKHSGLPWDLILSSELAKAYKPDPRVYLMAINLLSLRPEQVMMVAAHMDDLRAAKAHGLKTALVLRPLEFGYHSLPAQVPFESFDIIANDMVDLARQLEI